MASSASSHRTQVIRESESGNFKASQDNSFVFRNLQQLKSWRKALNLLGLRQVTYAKTRHFHGLVFRKPCQEIRELTSGDVQDLNEQEKIENMFYIPQDFAPNESVTPVDCSLEKLLDTLDRDIVVSDFHELPSIDFWFVFFFGHHTIVPVAKTQL